MSFRGCILVAAAAAAGCSNPIPCVGWSQWAQNAGHSGDVCVRGQAPANVLARVAVDPFASAETSSVGGDLLVHYQVPLIVDDDVYVLGKNGSFTPPCAPPDGGEIACHAWDSQLWSERLYQWSGNTLSFVWSITSDWKPVPSEFAGSEPTFQPVVVGDWLYLPGFGGSIIRVDRHNGEPQAQLLPVAVAAAGAPDPDTYVSGPLVADDKGNVYYNVLRLDHNFPATSDIKGWLVRVTPSDGVTARSYDQLASGAPTGTNCHATYASASPPPDLPWPPPPNPDHSLPLPPLIDCGSQRPGLNVAPAIGPDGTIFTVSRAAFSSRESVVVALRPDLSTKWLASLRGLLGDGCGINVALDGDTMMNKRHCRPGTPIGVERETGEAPAGRIIDESSSSPVALPDGAVLYGSYSSYNGARGHLFKFTADGKPAGIYDFGWDYTPAVWPHGGSYSIIVKDNHYNFDDMGTPLGPYYVTQLDANMQPEWRFQNTNTQSCFYDGAGRFSCTSDHPNGFEWCINAPAVDKDGVVYAGGEDGVVYAIGQGGVDLGHLFLSMALGASYTPLSIDHAGRLYTQNDGNLVVVGK
jgi:hypothetical protein